MPPVKDFGVIECAVELMVAERSVLTPVGIHAIATLLALADALVMNDVA